MEAKYIKNYNITNGGYKNNANTMYGEFKSGKYYFVYYTEMHLVEIYDCSVDELIDLIYYNTTHEKQISEAEYEKKYNVFFKNHNVGTLENGNIFNEIKSLYENR